MDDAEFEHLLRSAELRVTRPRLALLRAVRRQPHAIHQDLHPAGAGT